MTQNDVVFDYDVLQIFFVFFWNITYALNRIYKFSDKYLISTVKSFILRLKSKFMLFFSLAIIMIRVPKNYKVWNTVFNVIFWITCIERLFQTGLVVHADCFTFGLAVLWVGSYTYVYLENKVFLLKYPLLKSIFIKSVWLSFALMALKLVIDSTIF